MTVASAEFYFTFDPPTDYINGSVTSIDAFWISYDGEGRRVRKPGSVSV